MRIQKYAFQEQWRKTTPLRESTWAVDGGSSFECGLDRLSRCIDWETEGLFSSMEVGNFECLAFKTFLWRRISYSNPECVVFRNYFPTWKPWCKYLSKKNLWKSERDIYSQKYCIKNLIGGIPFINTIFLKKHHHRRLLAGHNYVVMHCTGYIKNAAPAGIDAQTSSCLVAIARLQVASMPPCVDPTTTKQFSVRIAEDGKTTFVDPKAAQVSHVSTADISWKFIHVDDKLQFFYSKWS